MTDIDDLAGVLVYTSADRFDEMRRFYIEAFGLTPRSDRPGFVNFDLGGRRITVAVHSEIRSPATDPLHVMVNLSTSEIEKAHRRAVAAGARSIRSPEREAWGGRVATLADPDGNLVQLLELRE